MGRCNNYQTKQLQTNTHTAHTIDGGKYSAGWLTRETIRDSVSTMLTYGAL